MKLEPNPPLLLSCDRLLEFDEEQVELTETASAVNGTPSVTTSGGNETMLADHDA